MGRGRDRNRDRPNKPQRGERMNRDDTDKLFIECVKVRRPPFPRMGATD
jgi:hypothetical protein